MASHKWSLRYTCSTKDCGNIVSRLRDLSSVYILKRSKTCTWSLRFSHEEPMIAFGENIYHEESFYLYIYIFISMRFYFIYFTRMYSLHKAGGPGPLCQAWSNEARHNGGCNLGRQIVYLHNILIYMVINKCLVNLLDFLFQAVGLHLQRNIFFHDFGT